MEKRLGVPALLDNDANAAALGELYYGAGRGLEDFVYLTMSTGIGGGVIVDGKVVYGVADGAGEVGHITILPEGPLCRCGGRGCLEVLCSGTAIARRAQERLASGAYDSSLLAGEITAKTVAAAAREGDTLAREVWDETVYYLAIGIGCIISTLAPEAIILGGGVPMVGDQLLEPLRREVRKRATMVPIDSVKILQASLGGDSGVYGALLLAQQVGALR